MLRVWGCGMSDKNYVSVRVEIIGGDTHDVMLSRMPVAGDLICFGDDCKEVKLVMHVVTSEGVTAVVRVL